MPSAPDPRISALNDKEIQSGDYVLYWMQQSQRAENNPAPGSGHPIPLKN